ncbi:helix-turn-helix domain-containing protein [Acuticoccus sp. M5D2P5]|uniref:helix-turn-helix domain-containing protein n=1 Tax=Acuticoccus kalidii TaxID=2910977 RepID=UPI001F27EF18|nr:helix-turn-helix transcriptional regulator [Acuticoccus kalidii]MCF3934314.1 helix-turn-helix domain-containing protein [Acuticoccus kalidii]
MSRNEPSHRLFGREPLRRFPIEGRSRAFDAGGRAQFVELVEPCRRERSVIAGVSDSMRPDADGLLDQLAPESVDHMNNLSLGHGRSLPNNLVSIKPHDRGYYQSIWRSKFSGMARTKSENVERPWADVAERVTWHRKVVEQMNQDRYGEILNAKRSQLSNWETGTHRLSLDGAIALNRAFGLSLDFLYLGDTNNLPMALRQAWLEWKREQEDAHTSKTNHVEDQA